MSKKRAAVIGAGLCGLGAMKSFKEEGFEPTCFEQTGYFGGLWRYHDDDPDGVASVMKTTIINTSKELGAMSNFPPPAEYPNYMHNSMMYEYIKSAVEKFDGLKHIKFFHETIKIEKAEDYELFGHVGSILGSSGCSEGDSERSSTTNEKVFLVGCGSFDSCVFRQLNVVRIKQK